MNNPHLGLKHLLLKLGIKSARSLPGITFILMNMVIHKPGLYTKVINVDNT